MDVVQPVRTETMELAHNFLRKSKLQTYLFVKSFLEKATNIV